MAKEKFPFDLDKLAKTFHIVRQKKCKDLAVWMQAKYDLTSLEKQILDKLYQNIEKDIDYWNEEELKMQLVSLLFFVADINVERKIKVFYERPLEATINKHYLSVNCDCIVGTPTEFNAPERPYFFLQEFKKGKEAKNDPEAQMLQAMLISQVINDDKKTVYGGFLIGSIWRFAILTADKKYCISSSFDADDKKDLIQIVFILRFLKELILNY